MEGKKKLYTKALIRHVSGEEPLSSVIVTDDIEMKEYMRSHPAYIFIVSPSPDNIDMEFTDGEITHRHVAAELRLVETLLARAREVCQKSEESNVETIELLRKQIELIPGQ